MSYLTALERLESEVGQLQDMRMQEARERDWLRAENYRLRSALKQFVAACNTARPISLMTEIAMAHEVAVRALSPSHSETP